MQNSKPQEKVFHGLAASPGIATGKVLLIQEHNTAYSEIEDRLIPHDQAEHEVERFHAALDKTRDEIVALQKRVQSRLNATEASIFDAHLLIVDDQMLMNEVEDAIRRQLKSAENSFFKVIDRYVAAISVMPDKYIKERAADILDVASRVLGNLKDSNRPALDYLAKPQIIIAKELTPSDTALLDRKKVLAFAVETGSNTSHTAILARSMEIPAVVAIPSEIFAVLQNEDEVIVDGYSGTVVCNPSPETRELYHNRADEHERFYIDLLRERRLRPETKDGFTIQLASNVETAADVQSAKKFGASGIGLFRTEYLFLNRSTMPSEEEQFAIYKKIALDMNDDPVIIRTLDIGGDKLSDNIGSTSEKNPFLGLRGIRLCLQEYRDVLRTQLRAILRAGSSGNLKVMFPMISCLEEVLEIKDFMAEIKMELKYEKVDFNANLDIGIMIETPSAALLAEQIADNVDFFSIGTNDLVQYTMAIDRNNERVAYLYRPSSPAILGLIKGVVEAATRHSIWVSVCGQMAGDPQYTPLLVGLGVHELSMSPVSLGSIRRVIRNLKMHEAEAVAQRALACATAEEALNISLELLDRVAPEISDFAIKGCQVLI